MVIMSLMDDVIIYVFPDNIEACHRLKKEEVKLKYELKYKVLNNKEIIKSKSKELNELKLSDNLYISESMCVGNHGLFSKCRELKKARKISTHVSSTTLSRFNLIRVGKFTKFFILKILRRC